MSVCPDCGNGWTFDFAQRRVYCRTCEDRDSTASALRALEAEMRASLPPDPDGVVYTWDVVSAMTVKAWADRLAALSTRSEPTGEPETRVDTPADAER